MEMPDTTIATTSPRSRRVAGSSSPDTRSALGGDFGIAFCGATADPLSELIQVRFFEAVPSTRPAIRHKVATAIRIDAR